MKTELLEALAENGCRGAIVSVGRVDELRQHIESHHRKDLLDEDLYQEYLAGFVFGPPESFPEARSLIVAAREDPQIHFTFTRHRRRVQFLVPPTYLHWKRSDRKMEDLLTEILAPQGHRVVPATLPKKLLAVRSGLAQYGKNNIAYIAGMGSFHRLAAFYSDLPCQDDDWCEPAMMERCGKCSACRTACPTGAIMEDRFLLRAERCIVFHNEKPSEVPFPGWMDPSWHNCLVGCMLCQRVCPMNRDMLGSIREGATFSQKETDLLLDGLPPDELPAITRKKLKGSDLLGLLDVLPRNLKALLDRPEP